jgi:hypothetical protein
MSPQLIDQFVESLREPGTSDLSPALMAATLGVAQHDLAAVIGVHRNTLRLHPESFRVQESLRGLVSVVAAAAQIQPDVTKALFLVKNTPVEMFGHRTLLQVVRDGRTDEALAYLRSISAGFVG